VLILDNGIIERLARARGIGDAYHDYRGELKYFSLETKIGILRAMGCPIDDHAAMAAAVSQIEIGRWRNFLPALVAVRDARAVIEINFTARQFGATLLWSVNLEDGSKRTGTVSSADCRETWRGEMEGTWITRRLFELPLDLPPGYHELDVRLGNSPAERCLLICASARCFEPEPLAGGRGLWGLAVQLYTVRSRENWGIGDFHDLTLLIRWVAAHGAGFIGLNPLHALAPADPERASPYSASSRHFLNVLYIAVPQVADYAHSALAQERCNDPRFQSRLADLRARSHVDYPGVAQLKFEVLEILYREFRERHLESASERGRRYRVFVSACGAALQMHARFDALDRHFRLTQERQSGWMNWPEEFRDVNGRAATRFAAEHPVQVEFFVYLQWLAHEQLLAAQRLGRDLGMAVGLYGDYAVGANPGGSETWVDRQAYSLGAEIGAPPDPLALKGQGWGIPPQDPSSMLGLKLQGFVRLLRNNMRYYGALRLDHVMSLFRLWWVPAGSSPRDGAYVHYPLHELLTVIALESARNHCLIVGEDLGVVPDEMRHAMPEFGLYHYKVLLFEKHDGRFRRPQEYVPHALATVTTHDMPTLRSFWEGRDIDLRRGLALYPSAELEQEIIQERERDRRALLDALDAEGLRPHSPANPDEPFTGDLAQALHLYLARSASRMVAVQVEDLLGMIDPVNVPGTHHEYPNWQRKLSTDIEDMAADANLTLHLERIRAARDHN
jgi:4-alpha-glucanotransferase